MIAAVLFAFLAGLSLALAVAQDDAFCYLSTAACVLIAVAFLAVPGLSPI